MPRDPDERLHDREFSGGLRDIGDLEREYRLVLGELDIHLKEHESTPRGERLVPIPEYKPSAWDDATDRDRAIVREYVGLFRDDSLKQRFGTDNWIELAGYQKLDLFRDAEQIRSRLENRPPCVITDCAEGAIQRVAVFKRDQERGSIDLDRRLLGPDVSLRQVLGVFLEVQAHAKQVYATRNPSLFPEVPESTIEIWKREYSRSPLCHITVGETRTQHFMQSTVAAAYGAASRIRREVYEDFDKERH